MKKEWRMIVAFLSALVVFCTTYALILPAITLEKKERELACPLSIHQHTEGCYQEVSTASGGTERVLTCGLADYVVHVHNEDCVDSDGNLVCKLPQIEAHHHSDSCYEAHQVLVCSETENEGHVHGPDCYIREQGELICEDTSEEHVHTDECYNWTETLTCGMEEGQGAHQHTDGCYQTENVLTCGKQELHTHSASCYDENGARVCGLLELTEHVHSDGCYQTVESSESESSKDANAESKESEDTNAESEEDSIQPMSETETNPRRLMEYAKETGNGQVVITVSKGDEVVEQDPVTKEYVIFAGETYNVDVAYSGVKIDPGKYYVTFTSVSNISLDQEGTLRLKANNEEIADVGRWYFQPNEDGTVWLIFDINENIKSYSNIDLIADVVCQFDYTDQPLDFDGNIKYVVKYNESSSKTEVNKWARSTQDQPGKIKWGTEIYGNSQSKIIGNTLTDTITGGNHYYTEDDMRQGIAFEATHYDGNFDDENVGKESHYWTVTQDTQGLTWTRDGWSYVMPETIECTSCGKTVTLGNDNWLYSFTYTSTMEESDEDYGNKASIDGDEDTGILEVNPSSKNTGKIKKTAEYQNHGTDTHDDDTIEWTIKATIFGKQEGKYDYCWHLWDVMNVDVSKSTAPWKNDLNKATVTATINGNTFSVPEKSEATGEDQICWECDYSSGVDGVLSKQEIVLYSHCTCTKDTCSRWADRGCQDVNGKGFCTCWCFKEDVELTFTYTTDAAALVDTYGDQNAQVVNNVQLNNVYFPNGVRSSRNIDSSKASVPLSGAFSKERTEVPDEDNDYKVEYTITVNEMMEHLESLQSITIDDTMTSTLAFLPDTLKIYKENKTTSKVLVPFEQYTLAYQPNVENEKTGELENLLKITLKAEALGPYKYTLVYQAAVSGGNAHYTYSNKASVELFAQTYDVGGKEYKVPKAAITGSHYGATLYKYDSHTGLPLGGVEFGLYEEGKTERIHLYTTGSDGIIQVETDTTEGNGVYLGIHKLYYLKEEKAPDGYQLDGTKYYFWFCDNEDSISCSKSNEFGMPPFDGKCIYTFQADPAIYDIMVSNKPIQDGYELPETGGSGTTMLYIGASVIMTSAAIILYKKNKRRKGDAASS